MADQAAHPVPVILFDGVCNLCNAWVAWVIRHDRRGVFRFASLQSEEGRAALAATDMPTNAPDSFVLIDDAGVHTRSGAAIRVARRLGLPWSLAGLAAYVPRSLRDGAYSWMARNRYRWFGRRESCMVPTPDLAARILDSRANGQEPPALPVPAPTPHDDGPVLPFPCLSQRFILAYLVIYIVPFPLDAVPGLGGIIPWVCEHLLGIDAAVFRGNGSGDTTIDYIQLLVELLLASVVAIAWNRLAKSRPVSARFLDLSRVYGRFFLGTTMLSYGWYKVLPTQMGFPGPDRLLMSFGDASPMGLLWTFMGASSAYQMFAGMLEVAGGFLLLFRRTALLGALISAAVLANIVALNFCYDVPVKLFSVHLFLIAVYVIASDLVRLLGVLVLNLPVQPTVLCPFPIRRTWLRCSVSAVRLAFVAVVAVYPPFTSYEYLKTNGILAPRTAMHGVYRVESFVRDGVTDRGNPLEALWVRLAVNQERSGAIQSADGTTRRFRLAVDKERGTLTITHRDDPTSTTLNFSEREPGVIRVEGMFEGAPIVAMLRKSEDRPWLLTSRGFHWINEFPFNP